MAASMLSLSFANFALAVMLVPSIPVVAALGADPELSLSMIKAKRGFEGSSVPKLSLLTSLRDITQCLALGRCLVVRFMHEDVAGVVHAVELHELMHQLESHWSLVSLVDLLAQGIFPEECRALTISAFLIFNDLESS